MSEETNLLKKTFLSFLIISLSIGVIASIIIFLIGEFSDIELKIIATTFSISAFSFLGIMWDKAKNKTLKSIGIALTILGFIMLNIGIWMPELDDFIRKTVLAYIVLNLTAIFSYEFSKSKKILENAMGAITTLYGILITLGIYSLFSVSWTFKFLGSYIVIIIGTLALINLLEKKDKRITTPISASIITLATLALQIPIFFELSTLFTNIILSTIILMLTLEHWNFLLQKREKHLVNIINGITVIVSTIFVVMLTIFILSNYELLGFYIRLTGSMGILYLFFTLLGPLINKLT
ncbi:MAG: hypothetical protein ACMXX9_04660 [Candidatus Woesearchaeota archaeon]